MFNLNDSTTPSDGGNIRNTTNAIIGGPSTRAKVRAANPVLDWRLGVLEERLAGSTAMTTGGRDRLERALEARSDARARQATNIEDARLASRTVDPDVAAADQAAVDRTNREHQVASVALSAATKAENADLAVLNATMSVFDRLVVTRAEPEIVQPKLPKGSGNRVADVEVQRTKLAALTAEARDVERAPQPMDEVVAQKEAEVDDMGARALPTVGRDKAHTFHWPVIAVNAEPLNPGYVANAPDARTVLCFLAGGAIKAHIREQLAQQYEGVTLALSDADKKRRLKEIAAEKLQVERVECALIWAAHDQGVVIPFRPDTDPRAVLGIA